MNIIVGLPKTVHNEIALAEANEFRKKGNKVTLCDYGNSGDVRGLFKSFLLVFKNAITLGLEAKKNRVQIVYLNTAIDEKTLLRDSITIFFLKVFRRKAKIVLKTHGTKTSVVLNKHNFLKSYVFKTADLILVLSKEEQINFYKTKIPRDKILITANAINKKEYYPDNKFRERYQVDKDTIILLFVGRFIPEKGIHDVVSASKLLMDNNYNFKLFCLGNGPLFNYIKREIKNLKLEKHIILVGHVPELETRTYYSNCDILILPTYHPEGFAMAIFQAVAAGKPIITTKIRAAADYFTEYENCLWVDKNNPTQIFEKVAQLTSNKTLSNDIGKNNLQLANQFTIERIIDNIEKSIEPLFQ